MKPEVLVPPIGAVQGNAGGHREELEAVPARGRRRLAARIQVLPSTPRPPGCEKLAGLDLYRVRHGDYRVVYEIADEALVVPSVRIDHGHDIGL